MAPSAMDAKARKPARSRPRRRRPGLADLMWAVFVSALLLTGLRSPATGEGFISLIAVLAVLPVLLARDLVDAAPGVGCPGCGARSMARVAVRPFGARYFRCRACGLRRKRTLAGLWLDASGPLDDPVYAREGSAGRWQPGPDLEFEPGPDPRSTTPGRLLLGKWSRRFPHDPGLR